MLPKAKKKPLSFLKFLDAFPKFKEDVKIKSAFSGFELAHYVSSDVRSAVGVDDGGIGEKLKINFDITFPALGCADFGMDMVDSAGDQMLEIVENVKKVPKDRGCRLHGFLEVNKVKGEFHVAFGRKAQAAHLPVGAQSNAHIHRFTPQEIFTFNCSHIIHRLSFGDDFPGVVQPLDNTQQITAEGNGRYQYFIQVVPTIYQYSNGAKLYTNQYSVTENTVIVHPLRGGSFKQPGVFFKYEISPYSITYIQEYKSFSHFVTGICAIVGGVWAVIGMISSSAWYINRYIKS